ncbi:MAG: hypothetical protein P4L84_28065 [Isosphaeraceae bacterium]|nr:hypothetical protein [Isosphaeraceae bacterium]
MRRAAFFGLALAILITLPAGSASAQWGWGGWGGGVGTVQGSIARGMGYYAAGAGQYNLQSAQAASINTDTVMRWNQFMFQSQMEANQREYARLARFQKRDSMTGELIYQRLRDNPNAGDIKSGNALNVILDQVTDPRIHSSALRLATDTIPASSIKEVPFFHASDAVTINLHQLTAKQDWPLALQGPEFAPDRKAYQDAIAQALKEDTDGEISLPTIEKVKTAAERIRGKFEANPPDDRELRNPAENYLKALLGMSRMLEKPEIDKVLAELKKVQTTTLGNLLSFMHIFNLRFGVADSPKSQQVYTELYPIMAAYRDRVLKGVDLGSSKTAGGSKKQPTDFFEGMSLNHAAGKPVPAPPAPGTP